MAHEEIAGKRREARHTRAERKRQSIYGKQFQWNIADELDAFVLERIDGLDQSFRNQSPIGLANPQGELVSATLRCSTLSRKRSKPHKKSSRTVQLRWQPDGRAAQGCLIPYDRQLVRKTNTSVTKYRGGYGKGVLVIGAHDSFTKGHVFITVRNCQNEAFQVDHYKRLHKVSVNRVTLPSAPRFHLQATLPPRVERINLIPQLWASVLAEEDRAVNSLSRPFASFDLKPEAF